MPSVVNYKPLYRESIVYPAIEKWIIEHQMTIKDFSKLIDVSYTHTVNLLHGYHEPRMWIIRSILNVTGLTFDEAFCSTKPLKRQRHVFCYRQLSSNNRTWEAYWPNMDALFKSRKLRLDDVAIMIGSYRQNIKKIVTSKNGTEPDMSLYVIKKFLEATNDTFEHLFALPVQEVTE